MTTEQMKNLFTMVIVGWLTQSQRINEDDLAAMAALYTAGLADLEYEVVKAAMIRVVRTSKFLPTIGEIREAAGVVIHGTQATGGEAWGSVVRALREQGSHRTPGKEFVFRDPITARVVAALGWVELCKSINATADRARFIETYNQIAKLERTNAHAADGIVSHELGRTGEPLPLSAATEHVLNALGDDYEPDPDDLS